MIKKAVAGTVLFSVLTFCGAADAASDDPVVDQFIVRFRDATRSAFTPPGRGRAARRLALPDDRPLRFRRRLGSGGLVYALPESVSGQDAEGILEALMKDPDVVSAEVDQRVVPAYLPTDALTSLYEFQWPLLAQSDEPFGIDMPDAWDVSRGDSGSVVAVLDTGLVSHEDLNPARILPGYDFISDVTTSNDSDGRDPDPFDPGDWTAADECKQGAPAQDSSWHGLLVSGLIAAEAENSKGIEGIDFHTSILPVRVLGKCGGHVSDIVDAMRWAVGEASPDAGMLPLAQRARIVNMSFTTEENGGCSPEEQAAIDYVRAAGAVVVTAAGNEAGRARDHSPGNCRGVINVAAGTRDGALADYSNFGENVDFVAPGGSAPLDPDGVVTLSNGGTTSATANSIYVYAEGTSFAAAQTAAVAGLIINVNPALTPDQVADILCATAQPLPLCDAATCGKGTLDANGALTLAQMSLSDLSVIPVDSCPVETSNAGSSIYFHPAGGGGGCVAGANRRVDPLFALAIAALGWRSRRRSPAQGAR